MAGYTAGLTVARSVTVRKTRRLPLQGTVCVAAGAAVAPETIVAHALIPGLLHPVRVAATLGVEPGDIAPLLTVAAGDTVTKGQPIAASPGLFGGKLGQTIAASSAAGVVETIGTTTGTVGVRAPGQTVTIDAFLAGHITDVFEGEGVTIEATGAALIQGIFGVGGEVRRAPLALAVDSPDAILTAGALTDAHRGAAIVGGAQVSAEALARAAAVGVRAVIVGGIDTSTLTAFLGYEIGVAITGQEDLPFTLIVTEGFGHLPMATRTFDLLASLVGREASLSGATQIRAGVLRPEIIVTEAVADTSNGSDASLPLDLVIGAAVRIVRAPYFGRRGVVVDLPAAPTALETGARVRVCVVRLADTGETVTVPRANVELM